MDFCSSCGILLSVPSKERAPYCKVCKINAESLKNHKSCDCELCSYVDRADFVPSQVISEEYLFTSELNNNSTMDTVTCQIETDDSGSDSGEQSQDNEYEQHENLKENLVDEDVRIQWEKQQTEFRARLKKEDSPDITALVYGSRRKPDGSRYHVGGVDISFIKGNNVDACACLTIVQMPDLQVVYQIMEMIELKQPYIPGFLAFREVPPLLELFNQLKTAAPQYTPDVVLVDGNGILHPRGFGLASQLGVLLDIPCVGVAKTLITAQGITDDDNHKRKKQSLTQAGDSFDLVSDTGEILGMCSRVHDKAPNPIYISVGHKITLKSAKWIVLECSKYRIPEPVRKADLDSREYIRQGRKDPSEFIKPVEVCTT